MDVWCVPSSLHWKLLLIKHEWYNGCILELQKERGYVMCAFVLCHSCFVREILIPAIIFYSDRLEIFLSKMLARWIRGGRIPNRRYAPPRWASKCYIPTTVSTYILCNNVENFRNAFERNRKKCLHTIVARYNNFNEETSFKSLTY